MLFVALPVTVELVANSISEPSGRLYHIWRGSVASHTIETSDMSICFRQKPNGSRIMTLLAMAVAVSSATCFSSCVVWYGVCVCVCVCERERERKNE